MMCRSIGFHSSPTNTFARGTLGYSSWQDATGKHNIQGCTKGEDNVVIWTYGPLNTIVPRRTHVGNRELKMPIPPTRSIVLLTETALPDLAVSIWAAPRIAMGQDKTHRLDIGIFPSFRWGCLSSSKRYKVFLHAPSSLCRSQLNCSDGDASSTEAPVCCCESPSSWSCSGVRVVEVRHRQPGMQIRTPRHVPILLSIISFHKTATFSNFRTTLRYQSQLLQERLHA